MTNMLGKRSPWVFGCDCSRCDPKRHKKNRRVARRRELRAWQKLEHAAA